LLLGCFIGCATAEHPGGVVHGRFPSPQTVEGLKAAPRPDVIFASDLRDLGDWELVGPFPEMISDAPRARDSMWDELAKDVRGKAGAPVRVTEALHCVAREYARIQLERSGRPDPSTRRFILGACNASVPSISFGNFTWEDVGSLDDTQLLNDVHQQALTLMRKQAAGLERPVVGIAFVRSERRAVLMAVVGNREVDLEPVDTRVGADGRIELRGRVLGPAKMVFGIATHGHYGVRECESVGSVALPRFHLSCDMDVADERASISLAVQRPNRVLANTLTSVLVWPQAVTARAYRRFAYTEPRSLTSVGEAAAAFVEELNRVRAGAGLGALTLDPAQTATVAAISPRFFAAANGEVDPDQADLMALGVLAGYDVNGMIRKGDLAFGAVAESRDLSVLLSTVLEEPLSRRALLDPDVDRIAVGALLSETQGIPVLGALMGTYDLFERDSTQQDAELVMTRLAAARSERELEEPYRLIEVWSDAGAAADDVSRGTRAEFALRDLGELSVERLNASVNTWYLETSDLESVEFPDETLSSKRLGIAIGVAHRKDPDAAWGRYVVLGVNRKH
jgi:hypothetical protein